ncbi:MAG: HzsA-related protein [Pirellulaceae bacterium]
MSSHPLVTWPCRGKVLMILLVGLAAFNSDRSAAAAPSDLRIVRPDRPNEVSFAPTMARFVRVLIHISSASQPCIDELEIYGPDSEKNLALAEQGGRPSASSCLAGYVQHAVDHLNDGEYGNANSWIAAGETDQWAQIELRAAVPIAKVIFSRDRSGQYADRIPLDLEVQLSVDGVAWQTVAHEVGRAAKSTAQSSDGVLGFLPAPPPPPGAPDGREVFAVAAFAPETPRQDEAGFSNLALQDAAQPNASSLLAGHAIHQIKHLNDGLAGNNHSWIAASDPSWAEIDLGDEYWIYHVALGTDASGQYRDRGATSFRILTGTQYDPNSEASTWQTVFQQDAGSPVLERRSLKFPPVRARWVRVAINATNGSTARIDELEVFGSREPIPADKVDVAQPQALTQSARTLDENAYADLLRLAVLAEEHAWLKTFGHADLSSRLVPYNGRVKQYPHHAPADSLPLAMLDELPRIDGQLDDACWTRASRGVARVAFPYNYDQGPLVETAVSAGYRDGALYLAIATNRLLSSHVAVVSRGDGEHAGILVATTEGLCWNAYTADGQLDSQKSQVVEAAYDTSRRVFEVRLPLAWFPECSEYGLRVGLGMGGQHTRNAGNSVQFEWAPLSITEIVPSSGQGFQVRLTSAQPDRPLRITGNAPAIEKGLELAPGTSQVITISGAGPLGPEHALEIQDEAGATYRLHLFRYAPVERTLTLMEAMLARFEKRGLDVRGERTEWASLRERHANCLAAPHELAAERQLLFEAYSAKRRLFLRDPDLRPLEKILFVQRHAYEPSHNYSVLLDAPYRPGGGVYVLNIPRRDDRCEPGQATLTRLFDAGGGIVRDPTANFDLSKLYFGYRPSAAGYFHLHEMASDGSDVQQLTSGPFHDYWPCPLPDGGLAFISTRCKAKFLCWRPQAAVLFRMDAHGDNIRPLSFANLTEWGPSVMSDGRIIWQRSEYIDKGADFSHTLWAIRPDGTHPELVFGNDIIQPNGYANGREVPGTTEFLCTLISHFGDLNGPLALVDPALGRSNPEAITTLTPEVPWPGMWPAEECFRDAYPISRDYYLCSHAPRGQFGLYVVDRFGNRELLYLDPAIGSMCPTLLRVQQTPPALPAEVDLQSDRGEFFLADVYAGLEGFVERGAIKYLRVCQEVRADLDQLPDGSYRNDHEAFQDWYATPVHVVAGPYGWPSYVAKASLGLVPVEADGSARFEAPAGIVLYFQALDENLNELQRMRSVVQLQPGEKRSCVGCHESRSSTPRFERPLALFQPPRQLEKPPWGDVPFAYEKVVQPVWDKHCVRCHAANDPLKLDFTGELDAEKVPASYRTLISQGWVHYLDFGYNSGGNEKANPLTFGTLHSKLWKVLDAGHYEVQLTPEDKHRVKCWIDLNCPLWPDYKFRGDRPGKLAAVKP